MISVPGCGAYVASVKLRAMNPPAGATPTGIESANPSADAASPDVARSAALGRHVRFTQVELRDQTDGCNELVHPRTWLLHPSEKLALRGNLFAAHNLETGAGQVFIKAAPLPDVRPEPEAVDLSVTPAGQGFEARLHGDGTYAWHVIPYAGGALDRTEALQRFQREQAHLSTPRFITNTWGDRGQDGRISHDFILREIEAAAAIGADLLQIDDGWQRGRSSNSVDAKSVGGRWEGFHAAEQPFWSTDPVRFPQGLEPIVEAATRHGLELGLWFAPDSSEDFAHWEQDVRTLVDLHRRYGATSFKLDSINIRSRVGEQRIRQMIAAVQRETDGRVVLDMDITAGSRLGYFGMIEAGPLFVENRYTDWRRYWPHQTLRTLWNLAPWVDPARLRMEFLNHARHADLYEDDPLAPAAYTPAALFATTLFANPLGWFECSNLPGSYAEQLAPLATVWKQHREAIFAGTIVPLGNAPEGFGWTGLASISPERDAAHILAFRGLNTPATETVRLPGNLRATDVEVLAGDGIADASAELSVTVPAPLGFAWLRACLG